MSNAVGIWMAWEGGVDVMAMTQDGLAQPNLIVHMARVVHTPAGSAPSGLLLLPGADGTPLLTAFVSEDEEVGHYFGPYIFAGTLFENAPVLVGKIEVEINAPQNGEPQLAKVSVEAREYSVVSELQSLGELQRADRAPGAFPFHENSLEAEAGETVLTINGKEIEVVAIASAVWSPCGFYAR